MEELCIVWKIIDNFIDDWVLRLATLASLVLTSILMLSAEARRHNTYPVVLLLLWAVYEVQPKAAEYAITHLSISSTSTSAQEQQLVAFWAPFLLLHLAGPDNIAAFTLEDGKLSLRKVVKALLKIIQGLYVMFKYIYFCNSGVLLSAASIMFALGVARYLEKVITQLRGNFDNLWHSGDDSKKKRKPASTGECLDHLMISRPQHGDEEALLLYAQTQFKACGRRAMADSSVEEDSPNYKTGWAIFTEFSALDPEDALALCKVAGMEASFVYDVLYTKATVVHTWGGYLLRLVSPFCTAAAFSLFWLYPKDGEETADVVITYILLASAFFLDVVCLLSALGSTWAHAYLNARANMRLHHALLCSGRWRKLHRMVVSLDLWRLLGIGKDPTSRRMWSGRVGRYNLLAECTRRPSTLERLFTRLASIFRFEDIWREYQHSRCISELERQAKAELFKRIQQRLSGRTEDGRYSMKDITTLWGQEAVKRSKKGDKLKGIKLEFFGREFQEDVLLWHVGTTVFLARSDRQLLKAKGDKYLGAVEALSDYLMFLVAVRPRMLPGLELRKLFEVTCEALKDSWVGPKVEKCDPCCTYRKAKLAGVLQKEMSSHTKDSIDANRRLIWVGNQLATELLKVTEDQMEELLELMFDVWVDKMLYAAMRCSKDSHAKQLGRGGELTTILWIVAEHAGPFVIGYDPPKPNDDKPPKNNGKQKQIKICHQHPVGPDVCPNISCVKDYCCMDDYYYC
jgi:hypothetical protein